jgi:chromosome segregation ATPase
MAKVLGAPTLTKYFLRTLRLKSPTERREPPPLPKGPESLPGAIAAVKEAKEEYEAVDPVLYKKVIGELSAIYAALQRAKSLGSELEPLVSKWRPESLDKLRQVKKLDDAAHFLTADPEERSPENGPAITELTKTLMKRLAEARLTLEGLKRWRLAIRAFLEETDGLKAALVAGSDRRIDWPRRLNDLTDRLASLTEKSQDLIAKRQETDRRLNQTLLDLENAESQLGGEKQAALLKRGEALAASATTLLRATVARRAELAEAWQTLPGLIGRPDYLDRTFLYAAINLSRAQSWLEELKSRLTSLAGRLSSSREARLAARETLAIDRDKGYPILLRQANRRLDELKAALKNKALEKAKPKIEDNSYLLAPPLDEATAQEQRTLATISEQLGAVAAERDRLKDELSTLKDHLAETGQAKVKLMKLVESSRRTLKDVSLELTDLRRQQTSNQDSLALIRHRNADLKESCERAKLQFRKLSQFARKRTDEVKELLAEKRALASQLEVLDAEARDLSEQKITLTEKSQELALALDQAKSQETTLTAELAGYQEELAEASLGRERLGQIVTGYRQHLDRLNMAHAALLEAFQRRGRALDASERKREEQKVRLTKRKNALIDQVTKRHKLRAELATALSRLEAMETERARLSQDIEAARAETERIRGQAASDGAISLKEITSAKEELATAKQAEEGLKAELNSLRDDIDHNLKPLIEILGLALWRGEAANRLALDGARDEIARYKKEAAAREAGVRIQGAGKEIEYLERLTSKDKELEKLRLERDGWVTERQNILDAKATDERNDAWVVNQLSVALVASDLRHEKLNRSLKNLKSLLKTQKDETVSLKTELSELTKNQAEALKKHQVWLNELAPLVAFFLDQGLDFWTQGPSSGDARQAVMFFLREENATLSAELDRVREERQGLYAERKSLLATQAGFKERLIELRGLLAFLLRQFVDNGVALAQAFSQRDELAAQLKIANTTYSSLNLEATLETNQAELKNAQTLLTVLETENASLKDQMAKTKNVVARHKADIANLTLGQERNAETIAAKEAEIQKLAQDIAAKEEAIAKTQTEVNRLSVDNQRLSETADRQAAELAKQKAELEALRASPRTDGQVEAAWGAVTYIGSKAADSLSSLQARLDQEARRVEESRRQIIAKDELLKELENRQDALAILFWTVIQMSADGQLLLPENLVLPDSKTLPPTVDVSELETDEDEEDQPKKNGDKILGSGILAELRKAAKKSLFALILAGGLTLSLPPKSQAEPLWLGGPNTPMVGITVNSTLTKGPSYQDLSLKRPEPGLRPLGHFNGEPRWESSAEAAASAENEPPATRAHCRSLNRIIDLSFLTEEESGAGQAEAKALKALTQQARKWGLAPEVWVRLIKAAYDREKTVYLTDLDSEDAPLILVRPFFPKMENVLKRRDFKEVVGRDFLPLLDGLGKPVAEFWDRLFMDFYQRLADPEEAVLSLVWHVKRRQSLRPKLEFGGQLNSGPILPADLNYVFLADYALSSWPFVRSRKKNGSEAGVINRFAADLCAASSVFGLPWSFLAILAHSENEKGAPWPTTLEIYGWAKEVANQVAIASRKWSSQSQALCDLDLLAKAWSEMTFIELIRKQYALKKYYLSHFAKK